MSKFSLPVLGRADRIEFLLFLPYGSETTEIAVSLRLLFVRISGLDDF